MDFINSCIHVSNPVSFLPEIILLTSVLSPVIQSQSMLYFDYFK